MWQSTLASLPPWHEGPLARTPDTPSPPHPLAAAASPPIFSLPTHLFAFARRHRISYDELFHNSQIRSTRPMSFLLRGSACKLSRRISSRAPLARTPGATASPPHSLANRHRRISFASACSRRISSAERHQIPERQTTFAGVVDGDDGEGTVDLADLLWGAETVGGAPRPGRTRRRRRART